LVPLARQQAEEAGDIELVTVSEEASGADKMPAAEMFSQIVASTG
jgi:hypothetical protein